LQIVLLLENVFLNENSSLGLGEKQGRIRDLDSQTVSLAQGQSATHWGSIF
jgi:hypothetical protein